jgi:hypothetical protein
MSDAFSLATATGGKPFERSATSLLGPADADHFRIAVGRYGDRWYCDPLPADDVWPAWDGVVPSISTIKKASGSDWSFVAMKRINEALEQRPTHFDGMDFDARYEAMKAINKLGLGAAAKRGTNVHLYAEAKLHGSTWRIPVGAPGHEYMGAVDAWFDQHQPELVAAEYVVIKRELDGLAHGYGGTPDGLLRIAGLLWAIDWKSRGEDSKHGAYPEEAEQIAAGVLGDYMIVAGPNGAERKPIPEVAGGLIVSIRPDGARSYPIELDSAGKNWRARCSWWNARLEERTPVGKPWPIGKASPLAAVPVVDEEHATRDNLLRRCRKVAEMSPAGAEWLKAELVKRGLNVRQATVAEFPLILEVLEQAETYVSAPFDPLPVPPTAPVVSDRVAVPTLDATPDEGPLVFTDEDDTFAEMRAAYGALDDAGRSWVSQIVTESIQAGRSLHMVDARSLRRVRVALGLALLAGDGTEDDGAVRALVHLATGVDAVLFPSVPLGAAVSIMSAAEAEVFVGAVRLFLDGLLAASVDDDGHVRLGVAA